MQYSVLTSAEVLKVVSRKLNLAAEWGMTDEMAATNLADMIKVAPVRATDLVDVIVSGPDPKLVQNIAKAVPEAYKQDREMRENRLVETAIKSLKDVLREQEDAVNEKMMALKKLIAESSYLPTSWRNGEHRSTLTAGMEEEDSGMPRRRPWILKGGKKNWLPMCRNCSVCPTTSCWIT